MPPDPRLAASFQDWSNGRRGAGQSWHDFLDEEKERWAENDRRVATAAEHMRHFEQTGEIPISMVEDDGEMHHYVIQTRQIQIRPMPIACARSVARPRERRAVRRVRTRGPDDDPHPPSPPSGDSDLNQILQAAWLLLGPRELFELAAIAEQRAEWLSERAA